MKTQGSLIMISAPSGTGKTSLVAALRQRVPRLRKSVSHTTRKPRTGEEDGVHYNFVTPERFKELQQANVFLESATVFGNLYGTSREWINETLQQGADVILEIDWQGAAQIRKQMPDAVSVFILPPSKKDLTDRLTTRNLDDSAAMATRIKEAKIEVSHCNEYDFLIVNDIFETTIDQLVSIITTARLRSPRQMQAQQDLIKQLCAES
jgi:guanylate kinase